MKLVLVSKIIATAGLLPLLSPAAYAQDGGGASAEEIGEAVGDVALTPLSDLNLRAERVPEALLELDSPYQPIVPRRCSAIGTEVATLDAALGPDADAPPADEDDTLDRVQSGASSIVGGLIPFRSLVRELSGAEDRERRLLELHIRGVARRAYLKGVASALGCSPPAAPRPYVAPPSTDE
jgi:hypothetical protein